MQGVMYWFSCEDEAITAYLSKKKNKPESLIEAERLAAQAPYSVIRKRMLRREMQRWSEDQAAIAISIHNQFIATSPEDKVRIQRRMHEGLLTRRAVAENERRPVWFGELDEFVFQELLTLKAERRRSTGIEWHIDHMIPLESRTASGLHCAANVQLIPGYLNSRKGRQMRMTERDEWISAA